MVPEPSLDLLPVERTANSENVLAGVDDPAPFDVAGRQNANGNDGIAVLFVGVDQVFDHALPFSCPHY